MLPKLLSLILLLALLQPTPLTGLARQSDEPAAAAANQFCAYNPAVESILAEVTQENWSSWVRQLSGEDQALVSGLPVTITTRYSPALFNGGSAAYDFVYQQLAGWYPAAQIEEHSYSIYFGGQQQTWKNLVLTIPGIRLPEEVVLLTTHLDSTSNQLPDLTAPGADDNATGSAALLEAARVMRGQTLARTLRLIWFSGEEQGMRGSYAYVNSTDLSNVVGVINVDMIGYDADGDRCFELHVGTLPASQTVGQCFAAVIDTYELDLLYEYRTSSAWGGSDHYYFWKAGVGAVLAIENFAFDSGEPRCPGAHNPDQNPYYHQTGDTYDKLNLSYGFDVSRAALAAALSLVDMPPYHKILFPMVMYDFNP